MDFKDIINNVSSFFVNLYQNYFALIIIFIVLLVALIVFIALAMVKRKKREKEDSQNANKQAIASLTTEEIENISKNVSNPGEFREMVETQSTQTETVNKNQEEVAVTNDVTEEIKEEKSEPKKPATKKQAVKVETPAPTNANKRVYTGKWKISQDESGYFAKLHASNGGLLLKTEHYTTMSGVKSGIETIKKNVESGNFAISIDKYDHYHFKLFSKSNKLICVSEDYSSKAKCESGIASVKRFATDATIILEDNND